MKSTAPPNKPARPPPPAASGERVPVLRPANTRPAPLDVSPEAVRRAVLQQTLQRPSVLYPAAIGTLGALAALVLGPALVFTVPAVLGLSGGVGTWLLDYIFQREKHGAEVMARLRERLSGQRTAAMTQLRTDLAAVQFDAGLAQLQQLQRKFDAFGALLGRKLDPGELTYGRYQAMTEQVFLAGIDNLARVADTLQALATIDLAQLQARLHALASDGVESPGQDQEARTLRERMVFHDGQRARIDQWLAENEEAMSQMDRVMAAIADLDTAGGQAAMPMEAAMQELKTLVERASLYSVQR